MRSEWLRRPSSKDILGLWAGSGGEGAKFWMGVLTDLHNQGVRDVFFVVCDGRDSPDHPEADDHGVAPGAPSGLR